MRTERFEFPNASGHRLAALLDWPIGKPTAFALIAHCFTCGKDNLAAKRISERLAMIGIASLRFDFTGLGQSEGDSPARISPRTSTISSPPPTTCARRIVRRRSSSATVSAARRCSPLRIAFRNRAAW